MESESEEESDSDSDEEEEGEEEDSGLQEIKHIVTCNNFVNNFFSKTIYIFLCFLCRYLHY